MNYAQIDEQGYCIGLSTLSDEVNHPNMIYIGEEEIKIGQKYDLENKKWLDEFRPIEPPIIEINEHEEITKKTYSSVETTSFDNLINMDMLLGLDDKLNKIIKHLGI